jgi:hypothetical protein
LRRGGATSPIPSHPSHHHGEEEEKEEGGGHMYIEIPPPLGRPAHSKKRKKDEWKRSE